MREGDLTVRGLGDDRLRVVEHAGTGRRIADVTDPGIAAELDQVLLGEDLVHEAHPAFRLEAVVVDREARRLLSAVLQDAEAIVQVRGNRRRAGTSDDAAFFLWTKVGELRRPLVAGHRQCLFAQEKFRSLLVRPNPQEAQYAFCLLYARWPQRRHRMWTLFLPILPSDAVPLVTTATYVRGRCK